jgi:outer membrane PBP1 activator LpoA protein
MKKIIFLALMGMLTLQSVNAQRKEGKTRTPEQMVKKLNKKLYLTDEQEKQITTLYSDFFKQDLSREERKSAMQELEKKITSLLTDEQKEAFEQMKKERPQRQKQ